MNLILFLAGVFLLTFIIGRLLEKIHIPWIFSSLFIGLGLAAYNPFADITSSTSFTFIAELGMFFLLFIIGFELDISKILKSGKFIIKTTFFIIFMEAFVGSLMIHYLFNTSWMISILVASSFATVGEAVLLPILDEFNLIKTKFGQTILGIGVLDDVVEVLTVIVASVIIGRSIGHTELNIGLNLIVLVLLFGLVFVIFKLKHYMTSFKYNNIPSLFLFVIFFMFLFVGIGQLVESAALGALLAGISLRNIIPKSTLDIIDSEVRTMAYGLFAPLFFLWVGVTTDIFYLINYPLLVFFVLAVINITKVLSSVVIGSKKMGVKKSIVLGISLCVKFSTSIVILKFLFEKGMITSDLYSVLIGTTIMFKFLIPISLSYLIPKWNIGHSKTKSSARSAARSAG